MLENSKDVVIVEGLRTAFIPSDTLFKNIRADELGAWSIRELILRTQMKAEEVDEVIMGNCLAQLDIAHLSAVMAGLQYVSSFTVNKDSLSSMESVILSFHRIHSHTASVVIASGVESLSCIPFSFTRDLTKWVDGMLQSKNWFDKFRYLVEFRFSQCKLQRNFPDFFMDGICKNEKKMKYLAREFNISCEKQDEFALRSYEKAFFAQKSGKLSKEITPVYSPPHFHLVEKDLKYDQKPSKRLLSRMSSPFHSKEGALTAGNTAFMADGSVSLLMMSRDKALSLGYRPLVSVHSFASTHSELSQNGLGLVLACKKLLDKTKMQIKDISLFEFHEAFSAEVLANLEAFGSTSFAEKHLNQSLALGEIDREKLNVNGGSLAFGHPPGATGARLVLDLMKEMKRRQVEWGIATSSEKDGQATALLLKNEED